MCAIRNGSMKKGTLKDTVFAQKMVKEIPEVRMVVQRAYNILETKVSFAPVVTAREACEKALHDLDTAYNWYSKIVKEGIVSDD